MSNPLYWEPWWQQVVELLVFIAILFVGAWVFERVHTWRVKRRRGT